MMTEIGLGKNRARQQKPDRTPEKEAAPDALVVLRRLIERRDELNAAIRVLQEMTLRVGS